ncbi:MAG: lipoyl synthase [Elusimicrobia bacterium]|nr:lipoyl synthase [Elusimicrobiota bacterium]
MGFEKKHINLGAVGALKKKLRLAQVNTVCESAHCPNIGECFCSGTATFLIGGVFCTRNCRFCAVNHGTPAPLDSDEPRRIADAVTALALSYVVITSVTRDDIIDGGARHFAATIACVRERVPSAKIEILVPDFKGDLAACRTVFDALPDVFAHNLETVSRLYSAVRSGADYQRSLTILRDAKNAGLTTKSGIMAGLGETEDEINRVMDDLRSVNCDILTVGQYLPPSAQHYPVHKYIAPDIFDLYKKTAIAKGFKKCASGSYVRSSYMAHNISNL